MKLTANIICVYCGGIPAYQLYLLDGNQVRHFFRSYSDRLEAVAAYRRLKNWFQQIDATLDDFVQFVTR